MRSAVTRTAGPVGVEDTRAWRRDRCLYHDDRQQSPAVPCLATKTGARLVIRLHQDIYVPVAELGGFDDAERPRREPWICRRSGEIPEPIVNRRCTLDVDSLGVRCRLNGLARHPQL